MFKSKKTVNFVTLSFFTFRAKLVFIQLKQTFVKALMFHYFDLKYYIRIETNVLKYAISKILS